MTNQTTANGYISYNTTTAHASSSWETRMTATFVSLSVILLISMCVFLGWYFKKHPDIFERRRKHTDEYELEATGFSKREDRPSGSDADWQQPIPMHLSPPDQTADPQAQVNFSSHISFPLYGKVRKTPATWATIDAAAALLEKRPKWRLTDADGKPNTRASGGPLVRKCEAGRLHPGQWRGAEGAEEGAFF